MDDALKKLISERTRAAMKRPEVKAKLGKHSVGAIPWNKGVKYGDEFADFKEECRQRNLGKKLSDETKKKMSVAKSAQRCKISEEHKGKILSECTKRKISRTRTRMMIQKKLPGNFEYSGEGMRSENEVLFAKWADEHNLDWEYEPMSFSLPNGRMYIPDFLVEKKFFVEVKPFVRDGDAYKMDSFVDAGLDLRCVSMNEPLAHVTIDDLPKWVIGE